MFLLLYRVHCILYVKELHNTTGVIVAEKEFITRPHPHRNIILKGFLTLRNKRFDGSKCVFVVHLFSFFFFF